MGAAWSTPANAIALPPDTTNTYAVASINAADARRVTEALVCTDFGFNLAYDSVILDAYIKVEAKSSGDTGSTARLSHASIVSASGVAYADERAGGEEVPQSDFVFTIGEGTGYQPLAISDVNSPALGVALSFEVPELTRSIYVDSVALCLKYYPGNDYFAPSVGGGIPREEVVTTHMLPYGCYAVDWSSGGDMTLTIPVTLSVHTDALLAHAFCSTTSPEISIRSVAISTSQSNVVLVNAQINAGAVGNICCVAYRPWSIQQ